MKTKLNSGTLFGVEISALHIQIKALNKSKKPNCVLSVPSSIQGLISQELSTWRRGIRRKTRKNEHEIE